MSNKSYKIVSSDSSESIESKISEHLNEGYHPIGGLAISNGVFYQALYHEENTELDNELDKIIEIARSGSKLQAVKMYKDLMGVELREAKDWLDSNC